MESRERNKNSLNEILTSKKNKTYSQQLQQHMNNNKNKNDP